MCNIRFARLIGLFFIKQIINGSELPMTILNKSDILTGINNPKKIEIEALNGELWLRPLSSAEINEILQIEAQGYGTFNASSRQSSAVAEGKMNLAKMQEKSAEAKYVAVHKSINNPKNKDEWEIQELKQLGKNAIDEIYDKIMEISGVDVTERDVKQFPSNE